MKFDEVIETQAHILSILEDSEGTQPGTIFQGTLRPSKEIDPIAVGYSIVTRNDFQIELRIPEDNQRAVRVAQAIQKKYKQINLESSLRVEVPTQKKLRAMDAKLKQVTRPGPLSIGLSVGHLEGGAGTLGCFVELDGTTCILSNNHVLALLGSAKSLAENPSEADQIYHPGKEDGVHLKPSFHIGVLLDYIEMPKSDSEIDCAIAQVDEPWQILGNIVPPGFKNEGTQIELIANPSQAEAIPERLLEILQNGEPVAKIGKATGYTEAKVSAINLKNLTVTTGKGNYIFNNIHEIRWQGEPSTPFTLPGDSGSLLYTVKNFEAFGLHFASDQTARSYCCDLHRVLSALNVNFMES